MKAMERTAGAVLTDRLDIIFQPMGETRAWPVATAWLEQGFVRWSSPCLDESHEHGDAVAFTHCLGGECDCAFPAFMRAMQWLDAVCFGAADLPSVAQACDNNGEYGLRCVFARTDTATLHGAVLT